MARLIGKKRGKSQKAYEEGFGSQAQLTYYKPLTQEMDTLQPTLASVTDNDGQQSALQSARLSTGSVDSGVGRSSSHNSYSKLSHAEDTGELASPAMQFLPAREEDCETIGSTQLPRTGTDTPFPVMKIGRDDHYLRQINQHISELGALLRKVQEQVKELSDRVGNLEMVQTELSNSLSQSGSSFAISDSNPKQPSFISHDYGTEVAESEPITNMQISINLQARPSTKTPLCRHHSDSQANNQRREEIRNKLRSLKRRPFSEYIHTIPEDGSETQEDHNGSSQLVALRGPVTEQSENPGERSAEEELRLRVTCSLPEFIELTNWEYLVPHLVSVDLSDPATTDYLLNENRTEHKKGVYFYLQVLPSKGPDAYTRFYQCLCDEKKHSGHKSLVQICNN